MVTRCSENNQGHASKAEEEVFCVCYVLPRSVDVNYLEFLVYFTTCVCYMCYKTIYVLRMSLSGVVRYLFLQDVLSG